MEEKVFPKEIWEKAKNITDAYLREYDEDDKKDLLSWDLANRARILQGKLERAFGEETFVLSDDCAETMYELFRLMPLKADLEMNENNAPKNNQNG